MDTHSDKFLGVSAVLGKAVSEQDVPSRAVT